LRTEKEFSETLLQNIPFGIMLVSSGRKIVSINPAGLKILGHKEDDVTGRICHQFVCPTAKGNCPIFDLEKKIENAERIALSASGLSIPILKNVVPIKIKDETFLLETFIDISERKELEAQLLQAQKMEAIGTLAGGFAHDINNSLQAISGYSQLLLRKTAPDDPDYKKLEIISNAAHKTSSLTRQLLTFSSKIESALKPVDLNRQIEQVVRLLEKTIPKMISIETDLDRNLHKILAEAFQIEQILMNLGLNARDAMPDGGRLFFTTENVSLNKTAAKACNLSSGEYVRVTVSDTGTGMKPSIVKHIFDPFFTTKESGKGTGLGLATVHGIIEQNHGKIEVESQPGQGTTFTIYWPGVKSGSDIDRKAVKKELIPGGNETILVAEDNPETLNLVCTALQRQGYKVLKAHNGADALKQAQTYPGTIDLLFSDLIMPKLGGIELAEELLLLYPESKLILTSGYLGDQIDPTNETLLNATFLDKPYKIPELMQAIRKLLDHRNEVHGN
ncbi:response regulator, partial [bacterium]|nr:response regulator [bacterium]